MSQPNTPSELADLVHQARVAMQAGDKAATELVTGRLVRLLTSIDARTFLTIRRQLRSNIAYNADEEFVWQYLNLTGDADTSERTD